MRVFITGHCSRSYTHENLDTCSGARGELMLVTQNSRHRRGLFLFCYIDQDASPDVIDWTSDFHVLCHFLVFRNVAQPPRCQKVFCFPLNFQTFLFFKILKWKIFSPRGYPDSSTLLGKHQHRWWVSVFGRWVWLLFGYYFFYFRILIARSTAWNWKNQKEILFWGYKHTDRYRNCVASRQRNSVVDDFWRDLANLSLFNHASWSNCM